MPMDEKSIEFKKGAYGRFLDTELESIFSQSCIHSDQGCSIAVQMSDGGFDMRVSQCTKSYWQKGRRKINIL